MGESGVLSFESGALGLSPLGRYASLAAASLALPEGAYTTLRTYGGNGVVRLGQHLARLEESVALKGTPGRIDPATVRGAIAQALHRSAHPESRVRLTFAPPRLFVAVEAFTPLAATLYEQGVA
jgi:branched-subunit amino acid aminotransferase/4-amino-4-deoxychorismate lyase